MHELRGALAVVLGRAQLLSRYLRRTDNPSPRRLLAGLVAIEGAARRAARRVDALEDERGAPSNGRRDRPPHPPDPPGD